jgi:N-acetylneuraminic acid mutarotase
MPSSLDANEAWLSGFRFNSPPQWKSDKLPLWRQKRFLHATVKLDDFRVLVIGGKYQEEHLACTEIYDSRTDSWEDGLDLNQVRSGHAAVLHNNSVYVFGGYNNNDYLVSIECLNLSCGRNSSKWQVLQTAKLSVKRSGCAAVAVGPLIYIMGGYESRSDWSCVDILDTTTGTMSKGPSMTTARSGCAAGVIGTTIHVVGGNDAHGNAPKTMETLTIVGNKSHHGGAHAQHQQWQLVSQKMSTARCFAAVTVVAHCLVVMGGHDGDHNTFLSSAEVFDTRRKVWWNLPEMCHSRYGAAAVTLGESRVVVIGGTAGESTCQHADSLESLYLPLGEDTGESSSIQEIRERLGALEVTISTMSEQMIKAERKRKEEFQAIMSQLMQIKNALNHQ